VVTAPACILALLVKLTTDQIKQYERDGMLLFPGAFTPAETELLVRAYERDIETPGPHVILEERRRKGEENQRVVRGIYGSHMRQRTFSCMARDPRVLDPVHQLLGTDAYVYQFKINSKVAFGGERWAWHQDFLAWKLADKLPAPRMVNVAVFLDEVTEFNGPVMFVPGSHREGLMRDDANDEKKSSQHVDPYDIGLTEEQMLRLVNANGLQSPKGPAGSVLIFHPEIAHGSSHNMSPYPRKLLIVTYNDVANLPLGAPRPEYIVCRDHTPLQRIEVPFVEAAKE
jgi:ectoine hydroxylase